jgi:transposase InsO family protein
LLGKRINRLNNQRSLRKKGCPYANAVGKATFNSMKTEFIKGANSCQLKYNNKPLQLMHIGMSPTEWHSSLNYLPGIKFNKQLSLNFVVCIGVAISGLFRLIIHFNLNIY